MDLMQHLILLVIILLVAGLAYIPLRWPGGLHMTFSQYVASDRWSKIYYSLLFLVTLSLLLWFFIAWFVPEKDLPAAFIWFTTVAVIFQIACTFVPEVGGTRTKIHRALTGISGFAMLPLVSMLALAQNLSFFTKLVAIGTLVVMLVLLAIALRHQRGHNKALLLQIGYYVGFFITILTATYIG
jgi:hypothetical protein